MIEHGPPGGQADRGRGRATSQPPARQWGRGSGREGGDIQSLGIPRLGEMLGAPGIATPVCQVGGEKVGIAALSNLPSGSSHCFPQVTAPPNHCRIQGRSVGSALSRDVSDPGTVRIGLPLSLSVERWSLPPKAPQFQRDPGLVASQVLGERGPSVLV